VRIVVKSNFIPGETVIVAVGELKGMFGKVLESDPEKVLFRG
jgi:transcription antitermination factor NusG